jgi:transcriptional regulator NrdR family protein
MKCPNCNSKTKTVVVDTRKFNTYVYRRRQCTICKQKYTTYEVIFSEKVIEVATEFRNDIDKLIELLVKLKKNGKQLSRRKF